MKDIKTFINESDAAKNCAWHDAFTKKFVHGTQEELQAYQMKWREECPKRWGPASKEADPDNLLDGAVCVWGSPRTDIDLIVVFDKSHKDYGFDSCKAVAAVFKADKTDGDAYSEQWAKIRKDYPIDKYWWASGNVADKKINGETVRVFDAYLS